MINLLSLGELWMIITMVGELSHLTFRVQYFSPESPRMPKKKLVRNSECSSSWLGNMDNQSWTLAKGRIEIRSVELLISCRAVPTRDHLVGPVKRP